MASALYYGGVEFQVSEPDYDRIEKKNIIFVNVLGYENGSVYKFVWLYCW